jgi:hypothetical protein
VSFGGTNGAAREGDNSETSSASGKPTQLSSRRALMVTCAHDAVRVRSP